ncbi:hypothetical protein [Pseudomonas sp. LB1P83]
MLAWNRVSLSLMAFGFVIERSGLLLQMLKPGAQVRRPNLRIPR